MAWVVGIQRMPQKLGVFLVIGIKPPLGTTTNRCRAVGNSRARWFSCQVLQLHSSTSSHQQLQGVTIAQLLQSGNSANRCILHPRCETAVPGHHGVPVLLHLHLQQPDLSYPDSNVEAVDPSGYLQAGDSLRTLPRVGPNVCLNPSGQLRVHLQSVQLRNGFL